MDRLDFDKYTIISNTCLGGFIYKDLHREYDNPFMWNMWNDEIVYDILVNFDTINFNNFHINKTLPEKLTGRIATVFGHIHRDIYSIIIDDKYEIYYPHYIENAKAKTLTKSVDGMGTDMLYYDVKGYLKETYVKRLERMKECKPMFILDTIVNDKVVKDIINTNFGFPIIAGSTTMSCNLKNKCVYTLPRHNSWENSTEVIKKFNILK